MEARACGRNRVKRQTRAPTDLSIPSDLPVSRKRRRARAEPEPGRDRKTSRNIGTLGGLSQGPRARVPQATLTGLKAKKRRLRTETPRKELRGQRTRGPMFQARGARQEAPGTRFPRKERGAVMVQSPSPASAIPTAGRGLGGPGAEPEPTCPSLGSGKQRRCLPGIPSSKALAQRPLRRQAPHLHRRWSPPSVHTA